MHERQVPDSVLEGIVSPDHLRYTGPPFVTLEPFSSGDALEWGDAGRGAATAVGLSALAGAALLLRRRTGLTPSAS